MGCFTSGDQAADTSAVQARACCDGCGLVPGRPARRRAAQDRLDARGGDPRSRPVAAAGDPEEQVERNRRELPRRSDVERTTAERRQPSRKRLAQRRIDAIGGARGRSKPSRSSIGVQGPRHRLTISTNATRRTTLSGHRTSSNLARIGQFTTHIQSHGEQVETKCHQ
jgi:hypothetical protein